MNELDNHEVQYTVREEIANGITHGLGVLLSIAGLVILIANSSINGSTWQIVSFSIFGSTLIILYLASTLYHAFTHPALKKTFKKVDHSAIFLLIAGTYTPFLLIHLRGPFGWSLLGVIWLLAFAGIFLKAFYIHKFKKLSLVLYLFMGWLCVIAIKELMNQVPPLSLALLFGGGLVYTAGVFFYSWEKLNYNHAVWHLFVLGGSILHYFSILKSV